MTETNGHPTAEEDLVAALGELSNPAKGGKVDAGNIRYKFVTLDGLLDAVRPVFARHRLAVFHVETNDPDTGTLSCVTRIMHASGMVWDSPPKVTTYTPRDNRTLLGASTFARRGGLQSFVGLVGDEDDDGQAAVNNPQSMRVEYAQTRPVTRAPKRADDPQDAPYQTPPTPPPAMRPDPVEPGEMGDLGSPSQTTLASKKSTTMMWALKRESPMTDDEFRGWVAQVLTLDSPDWHTADLTQAQVSAIIRRLQAAPSVGPDRPRAGQ